MDKARKARNVENVYPLTPMQRGLLFHGLSEPASGVYLHQIVFEVELSDVAAYERAWQHVVDRQPVLRTAFAWEQVHDPIQVVGRQVRLPVERLDWRGLTSTEQAERRQEHLRADRAMPFTFSKAPLVRLLLAQVDERRHVVIWTIHHVILDGWSVALVLGEVAASYEAIRAGREPALDPAPPFADYVAWLKTRDVERARAHWARSLAGFTEPTRIGRAPRSDDRAPADHAVASAPIPTGTVEALRAAAQRDGLTLGTFLQAAWAVLLGRYSGSDDVVFGTVTAGRPAELPGALSMVGLFVNTLPMRTRVDAGTPVRELLRQVHRASGAMGDHEWTPLADIQGWSDVPRGEPLFETILAFENYPREPGDETAEGRPQNLQSIDRVSYPLCMLVSPRIRPQLEMRLEYDVDRFDAASIERLLGHFRTACAALAADPDRVVGDLPMLSEPERHHVLVELNDTASPYPSDRAVPALFEAQAAATPDAVAASIDGARVSYGELDRRANQVANHLMMRHGVDRGTVVGICVDRSLDMLAGLLGILKAGCCYLPLDPASPTARRDFMLHDARAAVLLTQSHLRANQPAWTGGVIALDTDLKLIEAEPESPPASRARADDLAYVMYTSGSTGRPKGTLIEHRSIVRLVKSTNYVRFGPEQVFLQFAPISFDASTFEIWGALLNGARVVVAPPGVRSLDELGSLIEREGVTSLWLTGALFQQMVDGQLERLRGVRQLLAGGEALSVPHVQRYLGSLDGDRRLINGYGPTENTTFTCCHPMTASSTFDGTVPIGRPISNTRVYLLDDRLQPVPLGAVGELCIAGDGLARGYLNQPALTAERFVPDRFCAVPGGRLYRTGDRARYLADGTTEFIGRVDHQVKLRGFRIELGEIEAALAETPSVRDAVVLCREDVPGEKTLVAYVVGETAGAPSRAELREALRDRIPEYMVPQAFVFLDALPLTPNGKIDRRALPAPGGERQTDDAYTEPRSELETRIAEIWRELLNVDQVGVRDSFFDVGGHSLRLIKLHKRLTDELGADFSVTELFKHATIEAQARRLRGDDAAPALKVTPTTAAPAREGNAIAIVAMAGRFPGASDIETFWRNLRDGVESIRFFTDEELRGAGVPQALIDDPNYVKARPVIDGIDLFDAWYFGYNPREAERIDPQQRIFLECAVEALERAGCDPERAGGAIGVFAGASMSTYRGNLAIDPEDVAAGSDLPALLGTDKDYLPTRVSYKLDLRGPSVNIQSACSTSLVAVHEACRALLEGRCDAALAGGVTITVPALRGYRYQEQSIGSPDGHCRPFDARAQGTLSGSGAGVVILKRLDDALRDGNHVHAVIRGTAVNNDGARKVGFTAPSIEGQAEVIAEAQAVAGVAPDTIGYVEAHGTGTALGDPIEIAALQQVFGAGTDMTQFCAIGSLKSNMGHLNAAAGVGGLMKAALALEHAEIPASLHFEKPNDEIDLERSAFFVNADRRTWTTDPAAPRRAGVSSFGLGGTNAHAVLEEALEPEPSGPSRACQLLVLSAKSASALDAMTANLGAHLRAHPESNLADVVHTLQVGRRELEHRRAVACGSEVEAADLLEAARPGRRWTRHTPAGARSLVFLFPGQGAQYIGMGRGLYASEPVFRDTVDACLEELAPHVEVDLRAVLYPEGGADREAASARLRRTSVAQPALFVVEYALARLWQSWGIEPAAMIGHSIGEYVAACLAGVLERSDALRLVALRGRLMEQMPEGVMLSVPLDAERVNGLVNGEALWLSVVNAPSMCVVSGAAEHVAELEGRLASEGVESRRLHTSHAFHSGLMEGAVAPFTEAMRDVAVGAPRIPYPSNVTGDWIRDSDVADPAYWGRHIREAVRFGDGLELLLGDPDRVLLEVGPGRVLGTLARQQPSCGERRVIASSLRQPQADDDDLMHLTGELGQLWTAGVTVDWSRYRAGERRRRVILPTYPFERRRYWVQRRSPVETAARRTDPADWFYAPAWWRSPAPEPLEDGSERCLLLTDGSTLGVAIAERLAATGREVLIVEPAASFARTERGFAVDPGSRADFDRLFAEFGSDDAPDVIVHLWARGVRERPADEASARYREDRSIYSLLHLGGALGMADIDKPVRVCAVTEGLHDVDGAGRVDSEQALVLGPCRVMGIELTHVTCRNVDLPVGDGTNEAQHVDAVVREALAPANDVVVAYRNGRRHVESFAPARLEASDSGRNRLRAGGRYLITGGLGGIGLALAGDLARREQAKLVLTGRTAMPPRGTWEAHLRESAADDVTARRIRAIQAMERAGAAVMVVQADAADLEGMRRVVEQATQRFGRIEGVIHAAGVPGAGVMLRVTREEAARVLAPKVQGARVLERLFAEARLDFLVLCSSQASVKGVFGNADYGAANAYLDTFARRFAADTDTFTVSIDWNRWRESGMASTFARSRGHAPDRRGIDDAEGVEVFRRVLAGCAEPQIVVSEVDFRDALAVERAAVDPAAPAPPEAAARAGDVHPRPDLATEYVPPATETQVVIAEVWQDLLGLERVGANDDFFDLGGHSLLGTQLVSRVHQVFPVEVTLRELFEAPTLAEFAELVERELLRLVEEMPEEMVERLTASKADKA